MYRDRDDSESTSTHFGGQSVQEGEWVDFPPSPEEPSRVPVRIGRSMVPATHFDEGRDRGTARATLGQGLAVSAFPLLRARLALSIAHVSVRPPCHPGRSHLASPVGDHDYPCAIFPDSLWLKRSLAYAPGAKGLPRSSVAVCRPNYAGAESGMSDTSTTRHDREPLRTLEVLPLG
jgi:hypothetical protein